MATAFARRGAAPEQVSALNSTSCIPRLANLWWNGIFCQCLAPVARDARQKMVSKDNKLSVRRQCALLTLARSNLYYEPKGESRRTCGLWRSSIARQAHGMAMLPRGDKQFLETPWYGSRQMARHMKRNNHACGRHRVRRLMRLMRLVPIYQEPNTRRPATHACMCERGQETPAA